jgi:hypothetical protein
LLIVFAVHLFQLLLLAALELILTLLTGVLPDQFLLFLVVPLLHLLALEVLLPLHLVRFPLMFLVQSTVRGRTGEGRPVGRSPPAIVSPRTIRETAAVV